MVFSLSIIGSIPATTSSVNHLRCEMPKCSQIWNLKWRLVFRKQVALQPPHVWESFLNKLYAPKVVVPNVPKGNVFVKLPFLGNTSFQIRKKLQQLFSDKLTSCNLKIVFTSPVRVEAFSSSRISYLRCYFQDLFTSMSIVAAMLPIMERPNAILTSKFVNIQAFHISREKV